MCEKEEQNWFEVSQGAYGLSVKVVCYIYLDPVLLFNILMVSDERGKLNTGPTLR